MVPSPLKIAGYALKQSLPDGLNRMDTTFFDRAVAATMGRPDLFIGWATGAPCPARHRKRRGGVFVLDRACPHRDFQEALVARESDRLGVTYRPQPAWFRERQLEEYELAGAIRAALGYMGAGFPEDLH